MKLVQRAGSTVCFAAGVYLFLCSCLAGNAALPATPNGIEHLRMVSQSADRTEALFDVECNYDGSMGAKARLVVMPGKYGAKGSTEWFVDGESIVSRGQNTVSVKVRFQKEKSG